MREIDMKKMTVSEMSEKLNSLRIGMKIRFTSGYRAGKTYKVLFVRNSPDKKFNSTMINLLEDGLPETRIVDGIGMNRGKKIEISNAIFSNWYAQSQYMDWEIIDIA